MDAQARKEGDQVMADPVPSLSTTLSYALAYARLGWHVLPIEPGTKKPLGRLVPRGHHEATIDEAIIRRWWTAYPSAGIGVAQKASGLVTIDIDPRNGGLETIERLEEQHGAMVSDVLAYTGGGGEHRVFVSGLVENLPGKLGPGVDVKADGFIVVEPSIHPSGKQYVWEASSDPLHGVVPSTLPGWIRDLSRAAAPAAPVIVATRYVDPKQVEELRSALATLPADDYHQWVLFGNALSELGQAGFMLWDEWSKTSTKYDPRQISKWRSFKPGAARIESIFFAAQQAGWVNPMAAAEAPPPAVPVHLVTVAAPAPVIFEPADLLSPPGMLGTVAEWIGATSRKPQPLFDVQSAIAFCCAVLGRRFVSTHRNWPSLYLLNIGKSASGKEHGKWAVERLLEGCELPHLIGPAGYTSSAGVLSALHDQPTHITIIDEFGKALDNASVKNNARDRAMLTALMEVWGRADGVLRPQGYSTFGMSAKDVSAFKERAVRNPALTLLAMTTPDTFFEAIGSAAARDGFLNRFLIVESEVGRQAGNHSETLPIPQAVKDWTVAIRAASAGGLVAADGNPSLSPEAVEVPFSRSAVDLFRQFDHECVGLMNDYEVKGLADMFGRSNETAMRLALVVALGCGAATIDGPHAAWAINYVRHHALRTARRLETTVADSPFELTKKQALALIVRAGSRGMTERDLDKSSRKFSAMPQRQQVEVLNSLAFVGEIQRVEFPPTSAGKGKKRVAWVAVAEIADADGLNSPEGSND
ncbi:MAG: hypothetical protein RLZZ524_3134 [Pseudomonadota bacterium]